MSEYSNERIGKAAARYLELRGFTDVDLMERDSRPVIAAWDEDELVLVAIEASDSRIPDCGFSRESFEDMIADYMREHADLEPDFSIRGDVIGMHVIAENRSLIRHASNVMAYSV